MTKYSESLDVPKIIKKVILEYLDFDFYRINGEKYKYDKYFKDILSI